MPIAPVTTAGLYAYDGAWGDDDDDDDDDEHDDDDDNWCPPPPPRDGNEPTNAPEIDATTATSALAILICGLLILGSRKLRTA